MSEKKDFNSMFREISTETSKEKNGHPYPGIDEDEEDEEIGDEVEDFSLTDELDHEILMHREAHFGGDFKVMLDYYLGDHIGVNPDFEIERIEYLAEIEHQLEKNLAPLLLSAQEAERIALARRAYRELKAVYEGDSRGEDIPRLIADLILSEEEEPEAEIEAVVAQGEKIVDVLLKMIASDNAYDPLFPGYGYAPYLAILCLGKIKSTKSIIPLFEMLGLETQFGEEVVLEAFAEIGLPAKRFLLKQIESRPLTGDNVNAAFALNAFPLDEEVSIAAFKQLQDPEVRESPLLSIYLLCSCEALKNTPYQKTFIALAQDPSLPRDLQREMQKMVLDWER